ncbi:trypsin-1-like [Armigeres subalbatus]|uniref:trypsin-1-like n=1 Tax=Armigeres subalbatus TaxID=124917 RepID=UPI002ED408F0
MYSIIFALSLPCVLFVAAASLAYPNQQQRQHRIIGGDEIDIAKLPFMASLSDGRGHHCGGSIISSRWILTAAHCIGDLNNPKRSVRVGSSRHAQGGQQVYVKRSVLHPLWSASTIDYDFALLELSEELGLGNKLQAVELPEKNEIVTDGKLLLVSGWGVTENGGSASSDMLRAIQVPVVNQKKCEKAYAQFVKVTPRMLCAGYDEGGKDMCNEDSGGPLVDGNKQVGVVSWSGECAKAGEPGVYARVAVVRDWIKQIANV